MVTATECTKLADPTVEPDARETASQPAIDEWHQPECRLTLRRSDKSRRTDRGATDSG